MLRTLVVGGGRRQLVGGGNIVERHNAGRVLLLRYMSTSEEKTATVGSGTPPTGGSSILARLRQQAAIREAWKSEGDAAAKQATSALAKAHFTPEEKLQLKDGKAMLYSKKKICFQDALEKLKIDKANLENSWKSRIPGQPEYTNIQHIDAAIGVYGLMTKEELKSNAPFSEERVEELAKRSGMEVRNIEELLNTTAAMVKVQKWIAEVGNKNKAFSRVGNLTALWLQAQYDSNRARGGHPRPAGYSKRAQMFRRNRG